MMRDMGSRRGVLIQARVDHDVARMLDELRGRMTRTLYLEELIEREWKRQADQEERRESGD